METEQFRVAIVDDEREDVSEIIGLLQSVRGISVEHFFGYDEFGREADEIVKAASKFDLLVLDVYMRENDSSEFLSFASQIRGIKPFVAYTRLRKGDDVMVGLHQFEELQKLVLERGGVGLVTKVRYTSRGPEHDAQRDREYDVAERVLNFYWTWRIAKGS